MKTFFHWLYVHTEESCVAVVNISIVETIK